MALQYISVYLRKMKNEALTNLQFESIINCFKEIKIDK